MLIDNYPNPFNPETRIRYYLSSARFISLKIFNQKGELIRSLENGFKQSGIHIAIWDGKNEYGLNVSSGIYICQLQIDSYSQSLKIIKSK